MSTPFSTPIRQAKLGIASTKSLPLANEYKKLLHEQHQRLSIKHQQDLDLIDDIKSYVKARLSIERDYTSALSKLSRQHASHISKKFTLLNQIDPPSSSGNPESSHSQNDDLRIESDASDSRLQKRLANNGLDEPDKPCSLYKVWSTHINRLQSTSKNRADQFEQLIMVVDKLKDIRSHKASIGKRCLDTHLKRIHEDILVSMVDVEKARKLYYEDESQAKKARENEEKIKKKKSGLLSKFTDLQARREKTSAQREANDIQSTQARNDYIMALAAGNAHLQHYYQKDLTDFIQLIDDGVLDHCKIFMATLSECDLNSLRDALTHAQYWSKMINLTSSQITNTIFLDCEQSLCLRNKFNLVYEPCNDDPIQHISLEHNADYALQHEIDKWFTWFKKECRNLSQLLHQQEMCQRAFAEGKKSIELNGQTIEDLEPKIIELKQQIRKSEAAKLKAQARLKVIKEGGMQIEEWSAVESEIRADMARAHEELEAKRTKDMVAEDSSDADRGGLDSQTKTGSYLYDGQVVEPVKLQISKDSDDSDAVASVSNLASVSRSNSNIIQKQQNPIADYSALADPTLAWQDDYSTAWGGTQGGYNVIVTESKNSNHNDSNSPTANSNVKKDESDLLGASSKQSIQQNPANSMTVQSSSPLSAIVNGIQSSPSPYQGMMGEAYKSDYECDYNRTEHQIGSTASSIEPNQGHVDPFGKQLNESQNLNNQDYGFGQSTNFEGGEVTNVDAFELLNKRVTTLYAFDKTNEDDLSFSEDETLRVIEVNDSNWVKAINESTNRVGFVPTSYIKLLDDRPTKLELGSVNEEDSSSKFEANPKVVSLDSEATSNTKDISAQEIPMRQCRAIYDYQPEEGAYEEDGLPHLALVQGQIMRIIDQGEDDCWWLVEEVDSGIRGHVPSMLVEEIDSVDGEGKYDNDEDSYGSEHDDHCDSIKEMPDFEPPKLVESTENIAEVEQIEDINNNILSESKPVSSLTATSFIIIEPTPEVESKRIVSPVDSNEDDNKSKPDYQPTNTKIVYGDSSRPPTNASYVVVNDDFVLEGPTRKPHHTSDQIQHHETPTIFEENMGEELENQDSRNQFGTKAPEDDCQDEDSYDMPAPVCVVIESVEDKDRSQSSDGEQDAEKSDDNDIDPPVTNIQREFKHTGNVDVNPLLRHRAEEFSKQIIAEAIMMTPALDDGTSNSNSDQE